MAFEKASLSLPSFLGRPPDSVPVGVPLRHPQPLVHVRYVALARTAGPSRLCRRQGWHIRATRYAGRADQRSLHGLYEWEFVGGGNAQRVDEWERGSSRVGIRVVGKVEGSAELDVAGGLGVVRFEVRAGHETELVNMLSTVILQHGSVGGKAQSRRGDNFFR